MKYSLELEAKGYDIEITEQEAENTPSPRYYKILNSSIWT